MKKLEKFVSDKYVAVVFLCLAIFQFLLAFEKVARYFHKDLGIREVGLLIFEVVTVPITVFVLTSFLLKKFKSWFSFRAYFLGYFIYLLIIGGAILYNLIFPSIFVGKIFEIFSWPITILVYCNIDSVFGWWGWSGLGFVLYFSMFVFSPVFYGLCVNFVYKLLRKK